MQMSKKSNFKENLSVDFTRSLIHVTRNELNQKNTHIVEEVLLSAVYDRSNRHTESHIQSKSEAERHTTSRDDESHSQTELEQDSRRRRHNQ